MCHCNYCHKDFYPPRLGPRKVLQSGGLFTPPVYDLGVYIHYGDYSSQVLFYYYMHDLFCPRCGKLYEKMDYYHGDYWATFLGEKASHDAITRYFRYCAAHPDAPQNIYVGTQYGYPGNEV